jgi:hypothetical protein
MGGFRGSRRQQLAQLQLELTRASQRLDEIERRSLRRSVEVVDAPAIDGSSKSSFENAETRFAACVAFGMSKIRSA